MKNNPTAKLIFSAPVGNLSNININTLKFPLLDLNAEKAYLFQKTSFPASTHHWLPQQHHPLLHHEDVHETGNRAGWGWSNTEQFSFRRRIQQHMWGCKKPAKSVMDRISNTLADVKSSICLSLAHLDGKASRELLQKSETVKNFFQLSNRKSFSGSKRIPNIKWRFNHGGASKAIKPYSPR